MSEDKLKRFEELMQKYDIDSIEDLEELLMIISYGKVISKTDKEVIYKFEQ